MPAASDAFLAEGAEQASAFADAMVRLDALAAAGIALPEEGTLPAPVVAVVQDLFRFAHNLKGMSSMEGIDALTALAHAAENLLDQFRQGRRAPAPDDAALLLEAADTMSDMIDLLAAGTSVDQVDPAGALIDRLGVQVATTARLAAPARRPDPDAPDTAPPVGPHPPVGLVLVVELDDASALPGARAAVVFRHVDKAGTVVFSDPERETIVGGTARSFTIGLDVAGDDDEARAVAGDALIARLRAIPDVARVDVAPSGPDAADAAAMDRHDGDAAGSAVASEDNAADGGAGGAGVGASATTIRVDVARLDALMDIASELVIERNQLEIQARRVDDRQLDNALLTLKRTIAELRDVVQRVRMVPIAPTFQRLQRLVRETARDLDKAVVLEVEGADAEVDRGVVDEILQPMVHLLRNAVDHGIEAEAVRLARGKPARGTLTLRAEPRGDEVFFDVRDDGGGLDEERIVAKAIAVGIIDPAHIDRLDRAEILDLIFAPGFTTTTETSLVSGRGVGLDAVRSAVQRLGGSIEVLSEPGQGTTFRLRLPSSLVVMDALLVRVATELWALPITRLEETLALEPDDVRPGPTGVGQVISHRTGMLPVIDGGTYLARGPALAAPRFGVVVRTIGRPHLLTVDELIEHVEIVVKPVPLVLPGLGHIIGAAQLGDGRLALVPDLAVLIEQAATSLTWTVPTEARSTDVRVQTLFGSGIERAAPVLTFFTQCATDIEDLALSSLDAMAGQVGSGGSMHPVLFALGGAIDAMLVFGIASSPTLLAPMGVDVGNLAAVPAAVAELGNMLGSQFVAALADTHGLSVTLSPPIVPERTAAGVHAALVGSAAVAGPVPCVVLHARLLGGPDPLEVFLAISP